MGGGEIPVSILGTYHSKVGKLEYKTVYDLLLEAGKGALIDAGVTGVLATASYYPMEGERGYTFPGLYAEFAKGYMARYGYKAEELYDTLGHISCKAHKNAMSNPLAHMHVEYTHEFASTVSEKNPIIAEPLKLTDCSLVSDGAAAMVITRTEKAKTLKDKVVEIAEIVQASDHLSIVEGKKPDYELTAARFAINRALGSIWLTINDIDVAEVHDCFTITELLIYEALGLTLNIGGSGATNIVSILRRVR